MPELTPAEEDTVLQALDPEIVQNVAPLLKAVAALVTARMADAWDAGMEYGIGEWGAETFASDYERNPYRPKEASDV